MKLNEQEKNKLIDCLKSEYDRSQKMLDNKDLYYWLKDEKECEKHIEYMQKLKEKYENLEAQDGEVEVELNSNFFNTSDNWFWILGLIVIATIFGGNPKDFKSDIEPIDDTVN